MEFLVALLLIAIIPAAIAHSKGRSFLLWYVYGVLLWIVAIIHALVLKPDRKALDAKALSTGDTKKCPECAELVKAEAAKCRFCGHVFVTPAWTRA